MNAAEVLRVTIGSKINDGACHFDGHDVLDELNRDYPLVRLVILDREIRTCFGHWDRLRDVLGNLPGVDQIRP